MESWVNANKVAWKNLKDGKGGLTAVEYGVSFGG